MDFLLECIGFPPGVGEDALVRLARDAGEPAAWRGHPEEHRLLPLGGGLEVRADLDASGEFWSLTPHLRSHHRRRLAVTSIVRPPDSPFDALLSGWAAPPVDGDDEDRPGEYRLSTWISDARRIDRSLEPGHVLAVTTAGFALNVDRVAPAQEPFAPGILERPRGAFIRPLGGADDPGGCCDVSVRIRSVQWLRNGRTGERVEVAVCDVPDRPLELLVSPWQLERDGLEPLRPGLRIEGTFLFTGRIAGGLKRPPPRAFG